MSTLADVVLPLPLYKYFTYRIPSDLQEALQIGSRVVVPFGRKKYYTAIVVRLHDVMPQGYEVKEPYFGARRASCFAPSPITVLGMDRRLLSLFGRRCV